MVSLTAGCRCSQLQVFPSTWKTDPATIHQQWYIKYRFYDPSHLHPKQVVIKGMNYINSWKERVQLTDKLLSEEWAKLQDGWNPYQPAETGQTLLTALEYARLSVQVAHNTRIDMKSMLKYVSAAVARLKWDGLLVGATRRKHIRMILEECYRNKRFTDNTYNHYRKYLLNLFKYLLEIEMVDHNPVSEVSVKKVNLIQREVLSVSERETVPKFLKDNYYSFWRFMQIFFHSGSRMSELLLVRKRDVLFSKQLFRVIVKKGQQQRYEEKVILNTCLSLWKEVYDKARQNDYLFSEGLMPGKKPIRREQVSRRWKNHIKKKLGVVADFYSLKHLHTDLISEHLDLQAAAQHDSHSSTAVTMKHYAINEKKRQRELLKNLDIKL